MKCSNFVVAIILKSEKKQDSSIPYIVYLFSSQSELIFALVTWAVPGDALTCLMARVALAFSGGSWELMLDC